MIPDPDIFRLSPTLHVPSDGSDARAKLREGCLITGGAKEIYALAYLVNKRIIISFSNVWQIFSQLYLWMYGVLPSTHFGNTQSTILNFLIPFAILVLCHLR